MNAKKQVLIVHDDPPTGELLCEHLTKAGYEATWKRSGKEGLAELEKKQFDLVVLDYLLWESDGVGREGNAEYFLDEFQNRGHDAPIVIMTALTPSMLANECKTLEQLRGRVEDIICVPCDTDYELLVSDLTKHIRCMGKRGCQ